MAKGFFHSGTACCVSGRGKRCAKPRGKTEAYEDRYCYVPCDVQKKSNLENLVGCVEQFGSVDIWINNAGHNTPHVLRTNDESNVRAVVETNMLA
jgi:NADP-dependent 3-hydroxy acid dehydrogenase YdfG